MDRMFYHVLRKGLAQSNIVALRDEVPHGKCVLVGIPTCETLVGHVKESVVVAFLYRVADLPPLLLGRVDTGGIVCTCMEQEHAVFRGRLDIREHAVEVQPDRVLVVVPVVRHFEPRIIHHRFVVGPGWIGEIDLPCPRVEASHEGPSNPERARARDGLCDGDAIFLQGSRRWSVREQGSSFGEGRHAGNASIFLVGL